MLGNYLNTEEVRLFSMFTYLKEGSILMMRADGNFVNTDLNVPWPKLEAFFTQQIEEVLEYS